MDAFVMSKIHVQYAIEVYKQVGCILFPYQYVNVNFSSIDTGIHQRISFLKCNTKHLYS